jgi:protein involved in polysaccharide export with SLBB domain
MLLKRPGVKSWEFALSMLWPATVCLVLSAEAAVAQTNTPVETLSTAAREYLSQVATPSTNPLPVKKAEDTATEADKLLSIDVLDDQHKLGIGDKVSFRIEEDKIVDERGDPVPLFVTDSGELEIPYLGRVPATGKTCLQLAGEIKAVLEKKYYYHATVMLGLDILNKTRGRVYIAGKVKVPGYVEIPTDEVFTVSKAIMRAGGFSEFADKRHVKITRKKGGSSIENEIIMIDVAEVLEKGLAGKDFELGPDDRVFVPSKLINF